MKKYFYLLLLLSNTCIGQVIPSFTTPDTVCVNTPVNISNTSIGATNYHWNFCQGGINQLPSGTNLGNIGGSLSVPVFMDYILSNNNYYGFSVNFFPGRLIRLDFGNSLLNTPTTVDLGNYGGIIPDYAEGIQVIQNEGNWYAIIVGGSTSHTVPERILKIDFGVNITNTAATATNWGNLGNMLQPLDLHVFQDNGNWYGFTVNGDNSTITRFNFTNSFNNIPTAINLGNIGGISYPDGIYAIKDNISWKVFITNGGDATRSPGVGSLTRLDFGSSLLNTPVGINLGNPGGFLKHPRDLTIMKFCGSVIGFAVNGAFGTNDLVKMDFNNNLNSVPVLSSLGNTGNLSFPVSITKIFAEGPDLYAFVPNADNNTITRLRFAGCTNASIPNSTAQNPPAIVYDAPGTYNINLSVDEGLPTQSAYCRQVTVIAPAISITPDQATICNGKNVTLTATGAKSYSWSPATGLSNTSIANPIASPTVTTKYFVTGTVVSGCTAKDSVLITVNPAAQCILACPVPEDFNYAINPCSPFAATFTSTATIYNTITWDFGDGNTTTGTVNPSHTYASAGNYTVIMTVDKGSCTDVIQKTITVTIQKANIILTPDTTICFGIPKQLRTQAGALGFCWSPTTYLDNPNSANPVTSTPADITYYYTATITGNNLITNGDFSQGNTGFTSEYNYTPPPNLTEAQYWVSTNPQSWNGGMSACGDHTTGNGNMMMVNGSPTPNINVWKQTINVIPNTNYGFSTWVQALYPPNPAQLQFSINGNAIGTLITASLPTCTWTQFYTTWNSGNNTTAVISILNKNTFVEGNDFALDDISFAPVTIAGDSVVIKVDKPGIKTSNDTTVCAGKPVQLNTIGSVSQFSWSPATGLSNAGIASPVATPANTTQYIVTGTTINGCIAKDTVMININSKLAITKTPDTAICPNSSIQLIAGGGSTYTWLADPTLSNSAIANPIASPVNNTTYYVTVTDGQNCSNSDSVKIAIRPKPIFSISADKSVCKGSPVQLIASGGNVYSWSPAIFLNNASIGNPVAMPDATTVFQVQVTDSVCHESTQLSLTVTVLPGLDINVQKSNDIDCGNLVSQLTASGGINYLWTPAAGLSNPAIYNPVVKINTTTTFTVKGTDNNGCSGSDTITIKVTGGGNNPFSVPNAFTPNGDGLNDCFGISKWGAVDLTEFSVYNRFGEKVFTTRNPSACWDGNYKGKKQDPGGFIYIIRAKTFCGDIFRKGIVLLMR